MRVIGLAMEFLRILRHIRQRTPRVNPRMHPVNDVMRASDSAQWSGMKVCVMGVGFYFLIQRVAI